MGNLAPTSTPNTGPDGWADVEFSEGWGNIDPGNPLRYRVANGYLELIGWAGPANTVTPANVPGSPICVLPVYPSTRSNRINGAQTGSADFSATYTQYLVGIAPAGSDEPGTVFEIPIFGSPPTATGLLFFLNMRVPIDMEGGTDAVTGS